MEGDSIVSNKAGIYNAVEVLTRAFQMGSDTMRTEEVDTPPTTSDDNFQDVHRNADFSLCNDADFPSLSNGATSEPTTRNGPNKPGVAPQSTPANETTMKVVTEYQTEPFSHESDTAKSVRLSDAGSTPRSPTFNTLSLCDDFSVSSDSSDCDASSEDNEWILVGEPDEKKQLKEYIMLTPVLAPRDTCPCSGCRLRQGFCLRRPSLEPVASPLSPPMLVLNTPGIQKTRATYASIAAASITGPTPAEPAAAGSPDTGSETTFGDVQTNHTTGKECADGGFEFKCVSNQLSHRRHHIHRVARKSSILAAQSAKRVERRAQKKGAQVDCMYTQPKYGVTRSKTGRSPVRKRATIRPPKMRKHCRE